MTLGEKPNLKLYRSNKTKAKEYFIELFEKGYTTKVAHEMVSKWYGKEAADYAKNKVFGDTIEQVLG